VLGGPFVGAEGVEVFSWLQVTLGICLCIGIEIGSGQSGKECHGSG